MRSAGFILACMLLAGCTTSLERAEQRAQASGLKAVVLAGGSFSLKSFEREALGSHAMVFIEGDGRPWRSGGRVLADDPTPRRLLALQWMQQVPGPALYLGRPCYLRSTAEQPCGAMLWSYARYSEQVLQSMTMALEEWLHRRDGITSLTLVGHSGGGVLALLLAERVLITNKVVVLSAPVDIDLWTELHGYTPLFASLNPVKQQEWRTGVQRRFYFGEHDAQVPAEHFVPAARRIPNAQVAVVSGAGHDCCDPDIWFASPD